MNRKKNTTKPRKFTPFVNSLGSSVSKAPVPTLHQRLLETKCNPGNVSLSELSLCFDYMIRMKLTNPMSSFNSLIVVLAKNKHYSDIFKVYNWIKSNGSIPSFIMINILLNYFCNLNLIFDCFVPLGSMIRRHYSQNIVTYISLIKGCVRSDCRW